MRNRFENVLWIIGAAMLGVGAVGEVKIVIICGVVVMASVFGYKALARKKEKNGNMDTPATTTKATSNTQQDTPKKDSCSSH